LGQITGEEMKIRINKHHILARMQANNRYRWFVMPMIKASEQKRITNEKIKAIVDKAFPELA
jgi:hypothetical protein